MKNHTTNIFMIDPADRCLDCEAKGIVARPRSCSQVDGDGQVIWESERVCPQCGKVSRVERGVKPELCWVPRGEHLI